MICLDTTFLIDFLKKRIEIDDKVKHILKNSLALTSFSIFELYFGIYKLKTKNSNLNLKKKEKEIQNLIKDFEILNFDNKSAMKTAEILNELENKGQIIDLVDIMIASTSIVHGCKTIITRNVNHFEKISGIKILTYNLKKTR